MQAVLSKTAAEREEQAELSTLLLMLINKKNAYKDLNED